MQDDAANLSNVPESDTEPGYEAIESSCIFYRVIMLLNRDALAKL